MEGRLKDIQAVVAANDSLKDATFGDWSAPAIYEAAKVKGPESLRMVEYFISIGADVNKGNKYGWNSLLICASRGGDTNKEIVKVLLQAGASTSRKAGQDGLHEGRILTALEHARLSGHSEIAGMLKVK